MKVLPNPRVRLIFSHLLCYTLSKVLFLDSVHHLKYSINLIQLFLLGTRLESCYKAGLSLTKVRRFGGWINYWRDDLFY